MKQTEIETLLGRSLTTREVNNLATYLDIAKENLESLLCMSLTVQAAGAIATERTFTGREGYSTAFTDIFTSVTSVTIDGEAETEYHPAFWDNRNAGYYNSIVFDEALDSNEVKITALWGFSSLPKDLKRLWAHMFAVVAKKRTVGRVKSKRVEDFSVSIGEETDDEAFIKDNALTIRKYSMCVIGNSRHGETE